MHHFTLTLTPYTLPYLSPILFSTTLLMISSFFSNSYIYSSGSILSSSSSLANLFVRSSVSSLLNSIDYKESVNQAPLIMNYSLLSLWNLEPECFRFDSNSSIRLSLLDYCAIVMISLFNGFLCQKIIGLSFLMCFLMISFTTANDTLFGDPLIMNMNLSLINVMMIVSRCFSYYCYWLDYSIYFSPSPTHSSPFPTHSSPSPSHISPSLSKSYLFIFPFLSNSSNFFPFLTKFASW